MNIIKQLSHSVGTNTMPAIVGAESARPIAMIVRRMPRRRGESRSEVRAPMAMPMKLPR